VQQPLPENSDPKLQGVRKLMHGEADSRIEARRQNAINEWRSTISGNGNNAFFQLFVNLRRTGLSGSEIRTTLEREAYKARHPRERRDQVKGIMRTFERRQPMRMTA